ncbi:MAG: hypothetical protein ACFCVD_13510 [Nodosilinea sp.]
MVIVIPLETTDRLLAVARDHQLDLPTPLSSACASYLAPEQLDLMITMLHPLRANHVDVARLVLDLQTYRNDSGLPVPCS